MKKRIKNRLVRLFRLLYLKIFLINDTPHKIALGFGLGVFVGILPLTGPIAALFLAFLFRVNRAAALLGSLLTNTWLSIVTFLLSIKIGSAIMGIDWHVAYNRSLSLLKNFHWADIAKLSVFDILLPLALGYLVIAFSAGLTAYILIVAAISARKWKQRKFS
jgi:hypothetical protein